MMRPTQLRMARAALNWTVRKLAAEAGVDKNTISRFEAGRDVLTGTLRSIENVLSGEGVTFIERDGEVGVVVNLKPDTDRKIATKGRPAQRTRISKTKPK